MAIDRNNLAELLETQAHILKELKSLKYGDQNANLAAKAADFVVSMIGSWKFLVCQSILLIIWIVINIYSNSGWDQYPFILLNLMLSFQAAYSSPLILMASNRTAERDRERAADAYRSIEHIERMLDSMAAHMADSSNKEDGSHG